MSWLDTLRDRGLQAKAEVPPVAAPTRAVVPRQPKADIKLIWIQTRGPRNGDAGEVEPGWYSVFDGVLTMHDENGKPTGQRRQLAPDDNPHRIAGRLTLEACYKGVGLSSDFNRPLHYERGGFA